MIKRFFKKIFYPIRLKIFIYSIKRVGAVEGVCCCGDSMKNHADVFDSGHLPVDQFDYSISSFNERYWK